MAEALIVLKRTRKDLHGVFGELLDDNGHIAYTLEHYYPEIPGAKLPLGNYICKKGVHTLESPTRTFTTFEILNVPEHTGILFHPGNTDHDSAGCVLLGESIQGDFLVNSRKAFKTFMVKMDKYVMFNLKVV